MPFDNVPAKVDFSAQEREIIRFWQENNAFEKLRQIHAGDPPWSFIDGPITANNPMAVHHGWGRTYKDIFQRFWSMRGHKLRYQNGFDCQGLWVEVEVEKELGFKGKQEIESFGLERFIRFCKARVLNYAAMQTEQSVRLGYWMDWNDPQQLRWLAERLLEDPGQVIILNGPLGPVTGTVEQLAGRLGLPELGGSYFTMSTENNFMIWAFLKKCWEKGWLYRGADVMPWCPRCATGLSQHEIVTDGYVELSHPAVTLRFPLLTSASDRHLAAPAGSESPIDEQPVSLLVWTTTPWTLTSNVAAAVGPELTYVRVRQGDEILYLAQASLEVLRGPYQVLDELQGADMEGWAYTGPFDDLPAAVEPGGHTLLKKLAGSRTETAAQSHRVILWDEVGQAEGTGIVHIAPGCGAEDFQLGRKLGLPFVAPLDEAGNFVAGFGWLSGMHVSQVNDPIFADLRRKNLLYHVEPYTHRYPVCWRCRTELVFRLVEEWFISMGQVYDKPRQELSPAEKAASLRYQIMDVVDQIRWIPDFGYAREMDWLRNMADWMISKKRYWGLALPIWVCDSCGHFDVIGSEAELSQRAVEGWGTFAGHTPHRPYIDAVMLTCPECSGRMSRILDVGNPWLDAGVVPFSTLQYRTDRAYWQSWYPADWISESFPGQFRNWFYSMLTMATVLENNPPFRQIFGYASLVDENGREMHKSWGNAIEFNEAADKMGVDVMRWVFSTQKPENDLFFGYASGDEARRRFLLPLWNVYSFFVTYANLDQWLPSSTNLNFSGVAAREKEKLLDRWILFRLNEVIQGATHALEDSASQKAAWILETFLDDLSNWYVRRSRRRFWKSEHDADKNAAYTTLYHVLATLARLLAPFTPFVAEVIYQNLTRTIDPQAPESVHHTAWPQVDPDTTRDQDFAEARQNLLGQMALARQVCSLGLSARSAVGLKVRQPLARALVYLGDGNTLADELAYIICDELNVKSLEYVDEASTLVTYRILPNNKKLGPRFGAEFPQVRAALSAVDPHAVAIAVQDGLSVKLNLGSQVVELAPDEILIQPQPAAGLAVTTNKFITVAIDAQVTPELRQEGLAREVVRRVQAMRKEAGFDIADRIIAYYQAAGELEQAIHLWRNTIMTETLTIELLPGPQTGDASSQADQQAYLIDGNQLRLAIQKASSSL